ncbi:MAG TPA: tRNA pseudouridine(38-40) synthase TruA [Phycisphaerales bacterium]|nr:tRNA pseudouridine(38-40) synthase TruA [Phycisphaerales bacterium]
MPRYKLTVAYDGTHFHGWQKQHPPDSEPLRTAQGVLETAIREVVREPVCVLGASRTDAGVHAVGQVAAFTSEQEIPIDRLPRAINGKLPDDIQVRRAELAPPDFDPIQHCTSKGYRYRIAHSVAHHPEGRMPLFDRHFIAWSPYVLDAGKMHEAAQRLVGTHDFASFTRMHHGRESTVRTVFSCDVAATSSRRLKIDISGNGFLYNMIRIIAGTLTDVGRGVYPPEHIDAILTARDRTAAGSTMPPEGLCLRWVRY